MKIDGGIGFNRGVGKAAKEVEALGYDGAWTAETGHDPFLPLAIAAQSTEHLELGTAIAVAGTKVLARTEANGDYVPVTTTTLVPIAAASRNGDSPARCSASQT